MNLFFIAFGKAIVSTFAVFIVIFLGIALSEKLKRRTTLDEIPCDIIGVVIPIFLMFFAFFIMGDIR